MADSLSRWGSEHPTLWDLRDVKEHNDVLVDAIYLSSLDSLGEVALPCLICCPEWAQQFDQTNTMDVRELTFPKMTWNEKISSIIDEIRSLQTVQFGKRLQIPASESGGCGKLFYDGEQELWRLAPSESNALGCIYVPEGNDLRLRIVYHAHDGLGGHVAVRRTIDEVGNHFILWLGYHDRGFVRQFVKACLPCEADKGGHVSPRKLGEIKRAVRPAQYVSWDWLYIGPSLQSAKWILVIKDDFSNFVQMFPADIPNSLDSADALMNWMSSFGVMEKVFSDKGSHFKNQAMTRLAKLMKIDLHFHASYVHYSNGAVERVLREIKRVFKAVMTADKANTEDWLTRSYVPVVQFALNHMKTERLDGCAPIEVMTGGYSFNPLDSVVWDSGSVKTTSIGDYVKEVKQLQDSLFELRSGVQSAREFFDLRALSRKRFSTPIDFGIGDFVLISSETQSGQSRSKLKNVWIGPYQVTDFKSADNEFVYIVKDLVNGKSYERHAFLMKPYVDELHSTPFEEIASQAQYSKTKFYEIDEIVSLERVLGEADWFYKVTWVDFPPEQFTLEPHQRLAEDVPALLEKYLRENHNEALVRKDKPKRRKRFPVKQTPLPDTNQSGNKRRKRQRRK